MTGNLTEKHIGNAIEIQRDISQSQASDKDKIYEFGDKTSKTNNQDQSGNLNSDASVRLKTKATMPNQIMQNVKSDTITSGNESTVTFP